MLNINKNLIFIVYIKNFNIFLMDARNVFLRMSPFEGKPT